MYEVLNKIGLGFVSGLMVAAGGYWKANKKFEPKKFAKTVLVGAGVGAVAGFLGVEVGIVEGMPVYVAITIFVDYLVKGAWRRAKARL